MRRLLIAAGLTGALACGGVLNALKNQFSVDNGMSEQNDSGEDTAAPVREYRAPVELLEGPLSPLDQARKEVLSQVTVCKEELSDYWDERMHSGKNSYWTRVGLENYEECRKSRGFQEDIVNQSAVEVAEDVLESITTYKERCDGRPVRCDILEIFMKEDVAECTKTTPIFKKDFIWTRNAAGEITGTGAFPGWSYQVMKVGGGTETLVMSGFYYPCTHTEPEAHWEDRTGYTYRVVSDDGSSAGRAVTIFEDTYELCEALKKFEIVNQ